MARKETLGTRYTRAQKKLRDRLKFNNLYDEADEFLIDEFGYNLKIIDEAKADIKERGININVRTDPDAVPYIQPNPSVNMYLTTSKNLANILAKLGITVQERSKGKIEKIDENDPLGQLMQGNLFKQN